MTYKLTDLDVVNDWAHLPLSERVLERMTDILLASDDILDLIRTNRHLSDQTIDQIERSVGGVFSEINELMKKLTD